MEDVTFSLLLHFSEMHLSLNRRPIMQIYTVKHTCDFGFERAAHYVLWPAVFDGDEIVAGCHGCIGDLIAFRRLPTVHLDLGRPVDVDRQSARACVTGFDHKL